MNKIVLTENEFKNLIKETVRKALKESSRDDFYKSQIEKEFPGSLNSWDGITPMDEYYLELSNKRKEQDKLNSRELRKQKTINRNNAQKELDKQYRKENPQPKLNALQKFVNFLPDTFVHEWESIRDKEGWDNAFYHLIGQYLVDFSIDYPKNSDAAEKMIDNDRYEDYFFKLLDNKYGPHSIEW